MKGILALAVTAVFGVTAVEAQQKLTSDQQDKLASFERWAQLAMGDAPKIASGGHETAYYTRCIESYDEMMKAGVAPTTRVEEQKIVHGMWAGSVQELKEKWCDAGLKQAKTQTAGREAPYREALKADKLKMVIGSPPGHIRSYAVPGGEYTSDPKKLAAAAVWFDNASAPSNEIQVCKTGGKRIYLRRYAFDGQHKLTGQSSKEFCGNIPSTAYQ